jgi:hypothetical protein
MRKLTFISVLLAIVFFAYSQETFEKNFGESQFDFGHSVKQTFDGGYIITGTAGYSIMLTKTNINGDVLWTKEYGTEFGQEGYEVHQTSDSDYVFLSHTIFIDWGDDPEEIFLIKTNSIGDTLWTKSYGGDSGDAAESFQPTTDNGYIIAGTTNSFGNGGSDVYLIKTDFNGNTLWTKTFGTANNEIGKFVRQTNDNGYIILAANQSGNYLIKTDSLGDTIWTKYYDISAYQVIQSSDTGFVIVGSRNSDLCLIKTNFNGDILWTKIYYRPEIDLGKSIYQTSDEGYVIVGSSDIPNIGSEYSNVYLVKTNSIGDTMWTRNFGSQYMDFGESVQQTQDNGFIFVGRTVNFGASGFDVYLVKTNTQGQISGIEDKMSELNTILIFPNPTKNKINIEIGIEFEKIEIYNISGVKILSTSNKSIDFSEHINGIYFLRIIDRKGNTIITKLIVKQE